MWSQRPLADWPYHLPTLAVDETLYSWCATFHRRSLGGNALQTSRRLFRSPYAALLHDFPSHLAAFDQITNSSTGVARDVALRHTLLGYFLAFLEEKRAAKALNNVLCGASPHLKMHLGIPASGVGGYHPLRCCSECIERDRCTIGWPIWHVAHQCPSSLLCTLHLRPLIQTWHAISPVHQRDWITPDARPSVDRLEFTHVGDQACQLLKCMAEISSSASVMSPGTWHPERLNQVYRHWAEQHSLITKAGHFRSAAAEKILTPNFSTINRSLQGLGPVACVLSLRGILETISRDAARPLHPLKHIALLTSMFNDSERIRQELTSTQDPNSAQPTSITSQGSHSRHLITRPDLVNHFLDRLKQGQSLRATSSSLGISVTTAVTWARKHRIHFTSRAKVMKSERLNAIRSALSAGGGRQETARLHEVSLSTIDRVIAADADLKTARRVVLFESKRDQMRKQLQAVLAQAPQISPSRLRKTRESGWSWLERHDSSWLKAALPSLWSAPN